MKDVCVDVGEQLAGVRSFLPSREFRGSSSYHQTWQQAPLLPKLLCSPYFSIFILIIISYKKKSQLCSRNFADLIELPKKCLLFLSS